MKLRAKYRIQFHSVMVNSLEALSFIVNSQRSIARENERSGDQA
jgi:hypothetical protein